MLNRQIIIGSLLSVLCSTGVWAQDREVDKDPFFPSEKRPAASTQAPGESEWGRDPFSNPLGNKTITPQRGAQAGGSGGLTGIIYGKNTRIAIIDGEVYREGNMVGERKLVDIRKKSVVLMKAGGGFDEWFLADFSLGK